MFVLQSASASEETVEQPCGESYSTSSNHSTYGVYST